MSRPSSRRPRPHPSRWMRHLTSSLAEQSTSPGSWHMTSSWLFAVGLARCDTSHRTRRRRSTNATSAILVSLVGHNLPSDTRRPRYPPFGSAAPVDPRRQGYTLDPRRATDPPFGSCRGPRWCHRPAIWPIRRLYRGGLVGLSIRHLGLSLAAPASRRPR